MEFGQVLDIPGIHVYLRLLGKIKQDGQADGYSQDKPHPGSLDPGVKGIDDCFIFLFGHDLQNTFFLLW